MDSDSDGSSNNICPVCDRGFDTIIGIQRHFLKKHSASEFQATIDRNTQAAASYSSQGAPASSSSLPVPASSSVQTAPAPSSTQAAPPIRNNLNSQSANDILLNRVTCRVCGFLAKNERGLKIHERIHNFQATTVNSLSFPTQIDVNPLDEASVIQKFGELLYKCKCSIPLVRIIQKSVRTAVCQEFAKVVEYVVANNNLFGWCRLLSFPLIVLNTIPKSSYKDNHRPNVIRLNLSIFSKLDDIGGIFSELLSLLAHETPKKPSSHSEKLIIKIAQRKISEGDIGGAVRVLSSKEGIAENSPENLEKLENKHPNENSTIEEEVLPDLEEFDTSAEQIINAIRHFPISSSGGIDGLRPRHLKDLISFSCGDASSKLTSAMAKLVNVVRSGKVFPNLVPVFYGASLIALAKDNGDLRPIAIGLVWRRLAGKIACFSVKDSLSQRLAPIQNGFGIRGGSEAIVHAVRTFTEANHQHPTAIIKFDFRNAFNEMFRKFLLNEIKRTEPSLFPMLQQAYRCPSNLFFGDVIIQSKRGTQQGDPCAPPAFSIGMMPLTHSLTSKLNAWFLDDGVIGDEFNPLLADVKKVLNFSKESGLTLNSAKCEIFFINTPPEAKEQMLNELNVLLPGIKVLDESSFKLLGAPILPNGLSDSLLSALDVVKTLCKRLPLLDIHPALRILRSSLSSPRFQYLLRTSPTFLHMNRLNEIDEFYRLTLESITNNHINGATWTQASLPMAFAGLGIRKLVDLAHPAYFSSVYQSKELSGRMLSKTALDVFNDRTLTSLNEYPQEWTPLTLRSKCCQSSWDFLRSKAIFDELFAMSEPVDRARLLASSTKPSSKWLQAVPSHQLGLLLDNDSARIAVALRLGTKVCEPHFCICGDMVHSNGHHGLSCNKTKGKYSRHAEINKIMSMAFSAAGFPNRLEPYGLSRRDGKRPDGVTSYPWSRGRSLLWDATVVDTVAASYLNLTSSISGSAADQAERHKHNLYIDLKSQYEFTPLAFESFGAVGPETSIFLKKLGKLISKNTGEPRSLDFLLQRISIAVQRGNSVCVRDTFCDNSFNVFL